MYPFVLVGVSQINCCRLW